MAKVMTKGSQQLEVLCTEYRAFLDRGKDRKRICVSMVVSMAEAAGYRNLEQVIRRWRISESRETRVYAVCMGKAVVLFSDR